MSFHSFAATPTSTQNQFQFQISTLETRFVKAPRTKWSIQDQLPKTKEDRDRRLENLGVQSQDGILAGIKRIVDLACKGTWSNLPDGFESYLVGAVFFGRKAVDPAFRQNDPDIEEVGYASRCAYIRAVSWLARCHEQIIERRLGLEVLIHAPICITRAVRLSKKRPEDFLNTYPVLTWERVEEHNNFNIPLLVLLTYGAPSHDNYNTVSQFFKTPFTWEMFRDWHCSYISGVLVSVTGKDDTAPQQHDESAVFRHNVSPDGALTGGKNMHEHDRIRPVAEGLHRNMAGSDVVGFQGNTTSRQCSGDFPAEMDPTIQRNIPLLPDFTDAFAPTGDPSVMLASTRKDMPTMENNTTDLQIIRGIQAQLLW